VAAGVLDNKIHGVTSRGPRLRTAAAALTLLAALAGARDAPSQVPVRPTIRGTVVTEAGDRIPYAVIVLQPAYSQRFADENGFFALSRVDPGTYRLMVRQVGFTPFDSSIELSASSPPLRIALRSVALELPALTVESDEGCDAPGPPDSAGSPELVTVFEQLRMNADRYRLLAEKYPFRYRVERALLYLQRDRSGTLTTDTVTRSSLARWPYAPGHVVIPHPELWRQGIKMVHLPVLADLADTIFQANHCFTLRGIDTLAGRSWVRVDFRAARRVRSPDVDGSAWLDPASYQVGHIRVSLTHVDRATRGVSGWTATTVYREIAPNLIVMDRVHSETTTRGGRGAPGVVERTEEQRLLAVDFLRPLNAARDSVK
jgi:hypothetical protein